MSPSSFYLRVSRIYFLLQAENVKAEQKKLNDLQEAQKALFQKTMDAEKKMAAVKITKGGRARAVKKTEVLLAKLDAAVDECELLNAQWNGMKRYDIFKLIYIINDTLTTNICF